MPADIGNEVEGTEWVFTTNTDLSWLHARILEYYISVCVRVYVNMQSKEYMLFLTMFMM